MMRFELTRVIAHVSLEVVNRKKEKWVFIKVRWRIPLFLDVICWGRKG